MKTIIEKLSSDLLDARKARTDTVKISLLTTLISEAVKIGFDDGKRASTDAEVIATIKKFIKNMDEFKDKISDDVISERLNHEREILEGYLPVQLTEDDLTRIISEHIGDTKPNKGLIMKFLKENHSGQYDGKLAAMVIDKILT
jgi:uncharacterized protein YqeY